MSNLSLTPEHAAALRKYESLLEALPLAEAEKEHLVGHTLPLLNAKYLQSVGEARLELLNIQLEAFMLRRKMEMIRAAINRDSPVLIEVIDTLIEAEVKEQREKIERDAKQLQDALTFVNLKPLDDKDAAELKNLYHALARLLHPDLHPDLAESQRELWFQVSEAYQQGDLERMRVLWIIAQDGELPVQLTASSGLIELNKRINYLQMVLDRTLEAIEKIKTSFPYTHMELLDDPAWIAEQNSNTRIAINGVILEIESYKKLIELLLSGGQS